MILTVGSERFSDVEETTELEDVAMEEDLKAIVERVGSAGFVVAKLGGEAIYDNVKDTVEGFGAVVVTRPTIPA